jgi:hypothetical protein
MINDRIKQYTKDVVGIGSEPFTMDCVFAPSPYIDLTGLEPCYCCGSPVLLNEDKGYYSLWCSNFRKCKGKPLGTSRSKDIEKCKVEWKRINRYAVCEAEREKERK